MNKKVNKQYIDKILAIANKRYNKSKTEPKTKEESLQLQYPHLFVLGCVMDSGIDYERAWKIPEEIAVLLGGYDFSLFLSKDEAWYLDTFNAKKLHRYNEKMGKAFYSAIQKIHNYYQDNAANIWNDNPTSGELICRFLDFDRVGVKIATMAVNILSRRFDVKLKDKYSIDISPDIHVKRLMYRLGLIDEEKPVKNFSTIDPFKITYAARSINHDFPGLPDLIFWETGQNETCTNKKCNKEKCPFGAFCIKQGI